MSSTNHRAAALVAAAAVVSAIAAAPSAQAAAKPAPKSFGAHGVVVSHTKTSVKVLAYAARTGSALSRNHTVTVAIPSTRTTTGRALARKLTSAHTGDSIDIAGTSTTSGRSTTITARSMDTRAAPFHAYLGTISRVSGGTLFVDKADRSSDDDREGSRGAFTVNTTGAAITSDGTVAADGDTSVLAAGQTIALLGSESHDVVKATALWAFTVAPTVVGGEVRSVDGTTVVLGGDDHGDDGDRPTSGGDDDETGPALGATVDLAGASLIVDGDSAGTVDRLAVRTKMIVLGSTDAEGTFTASLAFAFTRSCSSRSHGDGGHDEGEHGEHGGHGSDDGGQPGEGEPTHP